MRSGDFNVVPRRTSRCRALKTIPQVVQLKVERARQAVNTGRAITKIWPFVQTNHRSTCTVQQSIMLLYCLFKGFVETRPFHLGWTIISRRKFEVVELCRKKLLTNKGDLEIFLVVARWLALYSICFHMYSRYQSLYHVSEGRWRTILKFSTVGLNSSRHRILKNFFSILKNRKKHSFQLWKTSKLQNYDSMTMKNFNFSRWVKIYPTIHKKLSRRWDSF